MNLKGRSLLAVFAHPDDESLGCGGLLAWSASAGARVSLLCATRGEAGAGPSEGLADMRTRELRAAAEVLGIADVRVLDYQDGMLPWADPASLERDIRETIEQVGPDVVVTFDEDGLYWHPDHLAIHARTTAAVAALGAHAPALYYVTIPPGSMRAVVDAVSTRRPAGRPALQILGIANVDAFGAASPEPSLIVDVGAYAERKLAALKCHRTQLVNDALDLLSNDEARLLLGTEHFRRASAEAVGEAFIERFADARSPA